MVDSQWAAWSEAWGREASGRCQHSETCCVSHSLTKELQCLRSSGGWERDMECPRKSHCPVTCLLEVSPQGLATHRGGDPIRHRALRVTCCEPVTWLRPALSLGNPPRCHRCPGRSAWPPWESRPTKLFIPMDPTRKSTVETKESLVTTTRGRLAFLETLVALPVSAHMGGEEACLHLRDGR